MLKMTRYVVAWKATGCAMGAYEAALKYAQERQQFGRPIGSFQLVQDLLAKMLANITASQCLIDRQAQPHAEGKLTDAQVAFATTKCRETAAWARVNCWAATESSPTTKSRVFSRIVKRSTLTRAPIRSRSIVGGRSSQASAPSLDRTRASSSAEFAPFQTGETTMTPTAALLTPSPAVAPDTPTTAALTLGNVAYEKKGAFAYVIVNRPKVLNPLLVGQVRRIPLGLVGNFGHPATALSGPHPEFESLQHEPPQPFSNGLLARLERLRTI